MQLSGSAPASFNGPSQNSKQSIKDSVTLKWCPSQIVSIMPAAEPSTKVSVHCRHLQAWCWFLDCSNCRIHTWFTGPQGNRNFSRKVQFWAAPFSVMTTISLQGRDELLNIVVLVPHIIISNMATFMAADVKKHYSTMTSAAITVMNTKFLP